MSGATTFPARPQGADAGFSLTELMVVIFIMSLVASFIVMTAPSGKPAAEAEAERLTGVLEQLSDRAIVSGQSLGLVLEADSYIAVRRDGVEWVREASTRHRLPRDVEMTVPASNRVRRESASDLSPIYAFDALGGALETEARIDGDDTSYLVSVGSGGAIVMEEADRHARR